MLCKKPAYIAGCATVDEDGDPCILYTGVVRRADRMWAEGQSLTCSKLAVERQLMARAADPGMLLVTSLPSVMESMILLSNSFIFSRISSC